TADAALEAVEAIVVDYEDLPVLTSARAAMAADAVLLHDSVPRNLSFEFEYGDKAAADAAFANAKHVVKLTLDAQRISGVPMEPKSCLARWDDGSGICDVYMQTQGMGDIQAGLAHVIGLPRERFRVHAHDVGGGYGVRNELYPENVAVVLAAKLVRRPVKWVGTRGESLISDHHGRSALLTGELALDGDGRFVGLRVEWLGGMGGC